MTESQTENRIHQAFVIGLFLKVIDGIFELIGGVALFFISPTFINGAARALTQHELSQDPHDFIANHILHSAGTLTHAATTFAAIYLLIHGASKLIVIIAVLKQKLWAYPVMIGLLSAFIVYQIYRIALSGSISLTLLTAFDAVMVWLTWHEYQRKRTAIRASSGNV